MESNFVEKVNDTAGAVIDLMNDSQNFNLSIEDSFPMTVYRMVEINGVAYRMKTTVEMKRV